MKRVRINPSAARSDQLGASLLELALAIVVLGIIGVLLARWYATVKADQAITVARTSVQRADDALTAFAAVEHRLPCPASDASGLENCSGPAHGSLPWRTLGLPDGNTMSMTYAVLRRANTTDTALDTDLAAAMDRTRPMDVLKAGSAVIAFPRATGYINGMDFCQALRASMRQPLDKAYVHTPQGNVAYALARHSPAMAPASISATKLELEYPSAGTPIGPDQMHHLLTVGPDQLWNRLQCASAMSAVNYSHYNIAATAQMQYNTILDLQEQLRVLGEMGDANVSAANAAVAQAAAGVISSTAETLQTAADMLKDVSSFENKFADTPLDITATALAAAATALAGANVITAGLFLDSIKNTRDKAKSNYTAIQDKRTGMTELSKLMAECLRASAIAADARGMNPSNAVTAPAIPSCSPP